MTNIYSKVEPDKLLHKIVRVEDIETQDARVDIIDAGEFLQCSTLNMEKGRTFKPHKHIYKSRTHERQIAQESWVVIRGSVKCILYDLDDKILATPILNVGDASFTLAGGHNYEVLEKGTLVYEYKTGPYEGQEFDKTFI